MEKLGKYTRIELIDENGRQYVNWCDDTLKRIVKLDEQDDDHTLKIFVEEPKLDD